jgi:putative peptidoglycan lipid II flippase
MLHNGLALANSLAAAINFILLFYFLRKKLGGIGTSCIITSFARTGLAALLMGLCGWMLADGTVWTTSGHIALKAGMLTLLILGSLALYLFASWLLRSEEMGYFIGKFREKIRKY